MADASRASTLRRRQRSALFDALRADRDELFFNRKSLLGCGSIDVFSQTRYSQARKDFPRTSTPQPITPNAPTQPTEDPRSPAPPRSTRHYPPTNACSRSRLFRTVIGCDPEDGRPLRSEVTTERFDESFDLLYDRAYRAAYRVLGERASSEDVALETLAGAWAKWS
jgi:hypothetical protein